MISHADAIAKFCGAMRAAGLIVDASEVIPNDAKFQRWKTEAGKTDKNAYSRLFIDEFTAGFYGDWSTGAFHTWFPDNGGAPLSAEEKKRRDDLIKRMQAERDAEMVARHNKAAETANKKWAESSTDVTGHAYLARKGIDPHGLDLRVGVWSMRDDSGKYVTVRDVLLVPMQNIDGEIRSLQAIFADRNNPQKRDKAFAPGGETKGNFFPIGTPPAANEPGAVIVITEGAATGASVNACTGHFTIVAFSANNLLSVAKAWRKACPKARIVIACDDDWKTQGNPGTRYGYGAADAVGGLEAVPVFKDQDNRGSDFNDLMTIENGARVEEIITAALDGRVVMQAPIDGDLAQATMPAPMAAAVPFNAEKALIHIKGNGTPKATIENVAEILHRMRATIRYNTIGKRLECIIPGESFALDNAENDALARVESRCAEVGMATGSLPRYVSYLAGQNPFNPVATWIESRPWDGVSRLPAFYKTITPADVKPLTDGRPLHQVLILRWMLSAVAAAFQHDGVSAHGVLVLQGAQYLGKTKWFKSLVPAGLGLTKDGMILRPDDKDSVKQVCSFWLTELGELDATFRKSDISALKSFITNNMDVIRLPYARGESHFARRTVFFGSVNPSQFLHDETGNRRYWTIECAAIDHTHDLDMQQVWAEVYALYRAGERHYLTGEEHAALNASNEAFRVIDPIEERLQTAFDWGTMPIAWTWRTSTDILRETGIDKPTQSEASKAGIALRKLNGDQGKRSNGKSLLLAPPPRGHRLRSERDIF
jgi:putative DNA primase/helicase